MAEVAGLALAILPLVLEVGKAYTPADLVLNSRRDEKLEIFYREFAFHIYFLDENLRRIVNGLPLLCLDCKRSLCLERDLSAWDGNEEVKKALLGYFGGNGSRVDAFLLILLQVLELVDQLTRDKGTKLSRAEKDPKAMYERLKAFAHDRAQRRTSSTFFERFRFSKNEKKRKTLLQDLETWGKRLKDLRLASELEKPVPEPEPVQLPPVLFSDVRQLFGAFTSAIESHWSKTCKCPSRHSAMICLRLLDRSIRDGRPTELEFDVLLPEKKHEPVRRQWLEGTFLVQNTSSPTIIDKTLLPVLCDALRLQEHCSLQFLIRPCDAEAKLWQMRSRPQKFSNLNNSPPMSLHDLLAARMFDHKFELRRKLALTFAYALFQCYATSCMMDMLRTESLYFYELEIPFVKTEFQASPQDANASNMALQHRSWPILRLGILLLEIHKGTQFETLLTAEEVASRSPNRDLLAARRVVDNLEDWCSAVYKDVVRACLELSWVHVGESADLADPRVCAGFYEQVIKPLEGEYLWLYKIKI